MAPEETKAEDGRPLVISLCGTYLKPEMQSIYRQIVNLRKYRTVVFTEKIIHRDIFPFEDVIEMRKLRRPRPRGNFILRFWYKHILKQWPPPRPITKQVRPYYPYNLPMLLEEFNPALVHVYYGHKAVKYRKMLEDSGVPFVVSFHGVDVVKFVEREGYVEELQKVFAVARIIMARSESLLERLEDLGCAREKMRLNRTPIPLREFPFVERAAPADGKWRLVQACRLIPKKGLFTTLEALGKVVAEWPELKFIVCGQGPIAGELAARIAEKGLERNVELTGWLDQIALKAEYTRAHAFLHPSELTESSDQEGVPNSMLEAMAAGLPVIGTYHGGIPEAVEDGFAGYLVPEKSPEELGDAILKMLADAANFARLSRNAATSVRQRYGLEEQIAQLEAGYHAALEGERAGAE